MSTVAYLPARYSTEGNLTRHASLAFGACIVLNKVCRRNEVHLHSGQDASLRQSVLIMRSPRFLFQMMPAATPLEALLRRSGRLYNPACTLRGNDNQDWQLHSCQRRPFLNQRGSTHISGELVNSSKTCRTSKPIAKSGSLASSTAWTGQPPSPILPSLSSYPTQQCLGRLVALALTNTHERQPLQNERRLWSRRHDGCNDAGHIIGM